MSILFSIICGLGLIIEASDPCLLLTRVLIALILLWIHACLFQYSCFQYNRWTLITLIINRPMLLLIMIVATVIFDHTPSHHHIDTCFFEVSYPGLGPDHFI